MVLMCTFDFFLFRIQQCLSLALQPNYFINLKEDNFWTNNISILSFTCNLEQVIFRLKNRGVESWYKQYKYSGESTG